MGPEIARKRARVIASSRGLGCDIALALAAGGGDGLVTGRGEDRLRNPAGAMSSRGAGRAGHMRVARCGKMAVDVFDPAAVLGMGRSVGIAAEAMRAGLSRGHRRPIEAVAPVLRAARVEGIAGSELRRDGDAIREV